MVNFENVIVPTDFSTHASAAIPHAFIIAKCFNAPVHLLHVFDAALYFTATAADAYAVISATPAGWLATKYEADELKLSEIATKFSTDGIVLKPVMRKGGAAHEIVKFADELHNPIIVIATHGRTGMSHLLVGSVTERVVRSSPCPVLTTPAPGVRPL